MDDTPAFKNTNGDAYMLTCQDASSEPPACADLVWRGAALRCVCTVAGLGLISRMHPVPVRGALALALAILFTGLDLLDGVWFWLWGRRRRIALGTAAGDAPAASCTAHFRYQATDKVVDLLSYAIALPLFAVGSRLRVGLTALVLLRAVGVALFIGTRSSWPLIAAPDGVKETLLLHGLGVSHPAIHALALAAKVGFEAYHHGHVNPRCYASSSEK